MIKNKLFIFAAVVLLFAISAISVFAAKSTADVKLTFDRSFYTADQGILVTVTITNPNKGAIRILRWMTPIDGVDEDIFRVVIDGVEAEYTGRHYKRPAVSDKDFITLRGGESIQTTVDLGGYYDLSRSGYYEVSFRAESFNLFTKDANYMAGEDTLTSPAEVAWINGRDTKLPSEPVDSVVGSTSFSGCTTQRQSDLNTARNNALNYSTNSLNYLNAGTVSSRFTTWFGSYTSSRYNTVRSHFSSITSAMDNASVTFNCGCTSSAYAYVYSNQPYTIYLCNAFWSAPAQGTDSKAGTLVHEMSHFTVVAGTSDYAYGQTAAKRLASTNPKRAINNADNHEYFAENTPSLP